MSIQTVLQLINEKLLQPGTVEIRINPLPRDEIKVMIVSTHDVLCKVNELLLHNKDAVVEIIQRSGKRVRLNCTTQYQFKISRSDEGLFENPAEAPLKRNSGPMANFNGIQ